MNQENKSYVMERINEFTLYDSNAIQQNQSFFLYVLKTEAVQDGFFIQTMII
jgi:hypothetical protein